MNAFKNIFDLQVEESKPLIEPEHPDVPEPLKPHIQQYMETVARLEKTNRELAQKFELAKAVLNKTKAQPTQRERIATAAFTGLLSQVEWSLGAPEDFDWHLVADLAVRSADALIGALSKDQLPH